MLAPCAPKYSFKSLYQHVYGASLFQIYRLARLDVLVSYDSIRPPLA